MHITEMSQELDSIDWGKAPVTLSSSGASPRDLRYAVKRKISAPMFAGIRFITKLNLQFPVRWICCLVSVAIFPVQAGWDFSPRMSAAEAYTDNVSLGAADQKKSAYITQLLPGFSLARINKNFLVNLDYQLESILYDNSLKDSNVFHQFDLAASKILPGDWASFEVAASRRQTSVNSRGTSAGNNLFLSSNRTNISALRYGPVFRWRPKSYLMGELSLQRGTVQYESVTRADSEQWHGRLSIDATQYPGRLGWAFQYSALRAENDISGSATFRRTSADLYFRVSSRTTLITSVGWDDNSFQRAPGVKQKGSSWRVGFNWNPRSRTTFSVFYNDRYYGESAEVNIQNDSKYTSVNINYREGLEVPGQARIANLAESGRSSTQSQGTISTEVVKVQRGTVTISRQHSKTETSMAFNLYNREFQESLVRENRDGIRVSWKWLLSGLATIDISARKQKLTFSDVSGADFRTTVRAAFLYQLGRQLTLETSLNRFSRTSSNTSVEYTSNTVMLTLSAQL